MTNSLVFGQEGNLELYQAFLPLGEIIIKAFT